MENSLSSVEYLERAEMHECLADSTADTEARRMHRAMAAEYRRRADTEGFAPIPDSGGLLKVAVTVAQQA